MKRLLLAFSAFAIFASCLWDKDTIEMEKQQFPDVIELISGNFLRHSPEYHEWRISDRENWLEHYPDSLELYDDLAVSYSKLENNTKAIELMYTKDSISPGLYETYANLGTFYIHDKQFEKGLEFIDKAIEINPEAHFGREVYQRHLVEYVLDKKRLTGKISLPFVKTTSREEMGQDASSFFGFILRKYNEENKEKHSYYNFPEEEAEKAITGVTGMMKFGNYDSPVLLEVLGDLLLSQPKRNGARHLAAMAYLKAGIYEDSLYGKVYVDKAEAVLWPQKMDRIEYSDTKKKVQRIKKILTKEIEKGEDFYNEIRANEIKWISNGLDPEVEFFKKYYEKELDKPELPVIEVDTTTEATYRGKPLTIPSSGTPWMFIIMPILIIGGAYFLLKGKKK